MKIRSLLIAGLALLSSQVLAQQVGIGGAIYGLPNQVAVPTVTVGTFAPDTSFAFTVHGANAKNGATEAPAAICSSDTTNPLCFRINIQNNATAGSRAIRFDCVEAGIAQRACQINGPNLNIDPSGNISSAIFSGAPTFNTPAIAQSTVANLGSVYVICQSAVAVSAPTDLTEDILYTCTIPANSVGPNGSIVVAVTLTFNNNANTKTVRLRYSGASGTQYINWGSASRTSVGTAMTISNRNATNSQISSASADLSGAGALTTSAVDTTASTTLVLTCQKAISTDSCTMERISIEVRYGA